MPRIHLYTGSGQGKTTSALGLALREIGHGYKVIIVQFMKGRKDIGEYRFPARLKNKDMYEIYQFGTRKFINLKKPSQNDRLIAKKGLEYVNYIIKRCIKAKNCPKLLILDEINLACAIGLLKVKDVIKFLDSLPKPITAVLTGRNAPEALIRKADLVTDEIKIRHPFDRGVRAEKGIEY